MVAMLFNWKFEGAEIVMDWVAVVGAISAVVLLIVEILRGVSEKKALSKEHDGLSKEHDGLKERIATEQGSLSMEHNDLKERITTGQDALSKEHLSISQGVKEVDAAVRWVSQQLVRQDERSKYLSDDQRDIKQHLNALQGLMRELETAQETNAKLVEQIQELQHRCELLQTENMELRHASQSYDYSHDFEIER